MKIRLKVIPKAKKEKVLEEQEYIKVYVREPPTQGRANKRALELLADYFKVKKYNIEIVKGKATRLKIIEIGEDS